MAPGEQKVRYLDSPPATAQCVVIGGGIVGAATAFYAARAGIDAVLVERRSALGSLTTAASTGAFRLQFDNEEELLLVRESVAVFQNFREVTQQDAYDPDMRAQGYLWLTTDPAVADRQRRLVAAQHDWGQTDIEVVSGDDARRRWPYIASEVVQARWRAGDGFLDPKALTMGFALGAGCAVVTDCGVTGIATSGDRVRGVVTTKGMISTDSAIVAAGPFSGVVALLAGIELPIETVARHKVVMPYVPELPSDAPMTIDEDTGAHWRPWMQGAYLLFTDPATPPSPPSDDVVPDSSLAFRLLDPRSDVAAARIAPFWSEVWDRGTGLWLMQSGHYTMTPDHRPLLGHTGIEGLYVNTGYSGHGIMGSAAGSRHLIDVVTGAVGRDDNNFRLDREFAERELDIL